MAPTDLLRPSFGDTGRVTARVFFRFFFFFFTFATGCVLLWCPFSAFKIALQSVSLCCLCLLVSCVCASMNFQHSYLLALFLHTCIGSGVGPCCVPATKRYNGLIMGTILAQVRLRACCIRRCNCLGTYIDQRLYDPSTYINNPKMQQQHMT